MLGCSGQPESVDGKRPGADDGSWRSIHVHRLPGRRRHADDLAWPMVTQALEQLLNDTRWKDVDYMIVDLPPALAILS